MAQLLRVVTVSNRSWTGHVDNESPVPYSSASLERVILLGDEAKLYVVMKFLKHVTAPHLKGITLIDCTVWDAPGAISGFLNRSGCQLAELVLQTTRVRAGDFLDLLPRLPTLRTLVLTDVTPNALANSVVEMLTPRSNTTSMLALPALTTLVVEGVYMVSTDKLLTMLERRTTPMDADYPLAPLVTIDITLRDRAFAPDELTRFAALRGIRSARLCCLDAVRQPVRLHFGSDIAWDNDVGRSQMRYAYRRRQGAGEIYLEIGRSDRPPSYS
ncbi:hypothetical protein C8R46DRAFT_417468 [Mycena filopes]|nr:hypothetical protein C8R46DRAFT_417468 [Mycena filopes]